MPPLMRPAAGVRPILIAGKEVIMEILELKKKANEVRRGILTAVHAAKSGHPGGSLSAADIFTYLYFEEMNIDRSAPQPRYGYSAWCSLQCCSGNSRKDSDVSPPVHRPCGENSACDHSLHSRAARRTWAFPPSW